MLEEKKNKNVHMCVCVGGVNIDFVSILKIKKCVVLFALIVTPNHL